MNAEKFLNRYYDFRLNEVNQRVYYKEKIKDEYSIIGNYELNSLIRQINNKELQLFGNNLQSLLNSNFVPKYNPFLDYFSNLGEWDGQTDYILELANTIDTTDKDLFCWAFKKWLVAMVACATNNDITNQTALILTGKQGIGKSTWLQSLVPKTLNQYYHSGLISPNNKDHLLLMSEMLIINLDELASLSKRNQESVKEMITKNKIAERRPYAYYTEGYIRRASFTGSANHNEILTDITGNRRFLCFEVDTINYNHDINLDNVYKQAFALLSNPEFNYFFDMNDIKKLEENNTKFLQATTEEMLIEEFFKVPDDNDKNIEYLNSSEIISYLLQKKKFLKTLEPITIGKSMSKKGFQTKKIKGYNRYSLVKL